MLPVCKGFACCFFFMQGINIGSLYTQLERIDTPSLSEIGTKSLFLFWYVVEGS
jgi:hypothetical protein